MAAREDSAGNLLDAAKDIARAVTASTGLSIPVSAIHDNLDQEVIQVTCDRLKLRLNEHLKNVESRRSWIAPLGVAITCLAALCTTEFKDFLAVGKATWQALFLLVMVFSFVWFVVTLVRLQRAETVDDVVDSLRHGQPANAPVESAHGAPSTAADTAARKQAGSPVTPQPPAETHRVHGPLEARSTSAPPSADTRLRPGDRVRHRSLGGGMVRTLIGGRVLVLFDDPGVGEKLVRVSEPMVKVVESHDKRER